MSLHIMSVHAKINLCRDCGKTFSSGSNLSRHVSDVHLKRRRECKKCGLALNTSKDMKRHRRVVHEVNYGLCHFKRITV